MDRKILSLLFVLCAVVTNSKGNDENANSILADNINAFARNSSNIIFEKYKNENIVYSPTSIHLLLAMLTYGSNNKTSLQLLDAICPLKIYPIGFKHCLNPIAFSELLSDHQNVTVEIANIMYFKNGIELNKNYKQGMSEFLMSVITTMEKKAQDTIDKANAWVDKKTNHKITKLIEKGDIDETTEMILLNAIYFNGEWEKPFHVSGKISFYTLNQTIIKIPMIIRLHVSGLHHGIDHDLKAQFVILPYKNLNYKIIFVVPDSVTYTNRTVFENLGENLKNYNYSKFYEFGNKDKEFDLTIPKFMMNSDINLEPILREMNITDAFDKNVADFSGILNNPKDQFSINKIIQKATIVVNEKGSEASIAPGTFIQDFSNGGERIIVNKPFYFAILSPHGTLFQGHIILPEYNVI